jgi:hypothetical protein
MLLIVPKHISVLICNCNLEEISSGRKSNNQYRIKVNFECDLTYYYLYPNVASSTDILT